MLKKAIILSAGLGERLRPLSQYLPKPLALVANRPLLEYHLRSLSAIGVKEVIINLHHLSHLIQERLKDGQEWGLKIYYSIESPYILGTGGGLAKVKSFFEGESCFFVINSEIYHDINLKQVLLHHEKHDAIATLVVRPYPGIGDIGWVGVNDAGLVRYVPGMNSSQLLTKRLFTGIHVLTPQIFRYLPENEFSCIFRTGYRNMLEAGLPVQSYMDANSMWYEIGTPKALLEANLYTISSMSSDSFNQNQSIHPGKLTPPILIGNNVVVSESAELGPFAIVGDGAFIGEYCHIERSVIFPNVQLPDGTELFNGIALPNCLVRVS